MVFSSSVRSLIFTSALALFAFTSSSLADCNGAAALCDRSYSNVTFIGTHDSAFVGSMVTENQNLAVADQLNAGIRYLQAQSHKNGDEIHLCHTSCIELDAGTLEDYLGTVKTWLDANTNEVVTLLLTNGDSLAVSEFDTVFKAAGIDSYAFVPSSSPSVLSIDSWPTMQEIIDSGKRFVVFLDYEADTSSVDYILDEFSYYFETPYDETDASFPDCSIDRPSGASATGRMYIVNHFLDVDILGVLIPDRDAADTTNAATGTGSIGAQSDLCAGLYARYPNVVLVDYFDEGDVFTAQNTMNGL